MIYINCDGGIDEQRGYCAFVVRDGEENYLGSRSFVVEGTSNECEYHGVIAALEWMRGGVAWDTPVTLRCDSRLVLQQIGDFWKCKEPRLLALRDRVHELLLDLARCGISVTFEQIPRSRNREADKLCNMAKTGAVKQDFTAPILGSFKEYYQTYVKDNDGIQR